MIALSHAQDLTWTGAHTLIKDADFANPFETGVEYSSPARGPWNIVHTGMLMPESHQIFVCAQSCLRGVVLTAAEMNAEERFSTITILEHNILDGDMENLIIDGVGDIVQKLPVRPRAILVFTSCIHHFVGCDLKYVYDKLHKNFPDIDITDCYMNPTMRKTLTPPDVKMRQQLYSVLHETSERDNGVNFIGNNFAHDTSSELGTVISNAGCFIRDICSMKTYDAFQNMAKSKLNITTNPAAKLAGETLEKRFGTKHLYLPLSYNYNEIDASIALLSKELRNTQIEVTAETNKTTEADDNAQLITNAKLAADKELAETASLLGNTPIAVDYTSTSRPLGLARLLLTHGMNVVSVYADNFISEEQDDFDWLKVNHPELNLFATIHPKMAILPACEKNMVERKNAFSENACSENACSENACSDNKTTPPQNKNTLAIGQKAAYFTGTTHFVNMIEGSGLWGYTGIVKLMELIKDAYLHEKDTAKIIQVKGWGCCA